MKTSLTALLLLSTSAAYSSPDLRLIELSPGNQSWMTPEQIHSLMKKSHKEGHCGGFMDVTDYQDALPLHGALHLFNSFPEKPAQQDLVTPLLSLVNSTYLEENVAKLSSYNNRYYQSETGVEAAEWIRDQFIRYAGNRQDIHVELYKHPRWKQPSVVATIEGLTNEIVVIGGHEDSINSQSFFPSPNDHAPGADDNASGTSTILEIFRVIAESGFQPKRTIQFMTYAGEEKGLLGSQEIANQYQRENKNVVAAMQFDMTMYPGSSGELTFITDNTNASLTTFTKMLVDEYVKAPWKDGNCGYACSDHASWHRAGYASVFPFEAATREMNPNIHTTKDLSSELDFNFGSHFAKLGVAFAIEMAQAGLF
ncbi:MAG: hypothetical protein CL678_13100 [Bdellovibrionaceae bacterium]|nr:hypothetical protein [Pseudobdellovibrionaceae bacterium]